MLLAFGIVAPVFAEEFAAVAALAGPAAAGFAGATLTETEAGFCAGEALTLTALGCAFAAGC